MSVFFGLLIYSCYLFMIMLRAPVRDLRRGHAAGCSQSWSNMQLPQVDEMWKLPEWTSRWKWRRLVEKRNKVDVVLRICTAAVLFCFFGAVNHRHTFLSNVLGTPGEFTRFNNVGLVEENYCWCKKNASNVLEWRHWRKRRLGFETTSVMTATENGWARRSKEEETRLLYQFLFC